MRVRASVLVAVFALPCVLGASWLGCASGDEEVEGAPKRFTETGGTGTDTAGGGSDTGGGGGSDTGGGGGSDTSKPLCSGEVGTPNACSTAVDLGTIAVGATKNVTDALPVTGGDMWFKVKFETLENLAAHPRITLTSTDAAIVLEVVKSCAGETVGCGDEDAFAIRIKDYEVVYRADPAAPGSFADAEPDALLPIVVGDGGAVYVRVFRTTGTPTACDFKLDLSN